MTINTLEIKKIKEDKIFKKKIEDKLFWVKPIKESDYKQGDIKAHIIYFKILKKYLKDSLPKIKSKKIKIENRKYLVNYVENISGKILSEKDFAKLLKLEINIKLMKGINKLLEKGYVLDFYGKKNFIQGKNKKIYYIDTRMPLFTKNSNEGNRFNISKKKTLKFLK